MTKQLFLNLDDLHSEGYIYTEFDVGDSGHSITINSKDKEKFLDAFAEEWRKKAEEQLEEVKENE